MDFVLLLDLYTQLAVFSPFPRGSPLFFPSVEKNSDLPFQCGLWILQKVPKSWKRTKLLTGSMVEWYIGIFTYMNG